MSSYIIKLPDNQGPPKNLQSVVQQRITKLNELSSNRQKQQTYHTNNTYLTELKELAKVNQINLDNDDKSYRGRNNPYGSVHTDDYLASASASETEDDGSVGESSYSESVSVISDGFCTASYTSYGSSEYSQDYKARRNQKQGRDGRYRESKYKGGGKVKTASPTRQNKKSKLISTRNKHNEYGRHGRHGVHDTTDIDFLSESDDRSRRINNEIDEILERDRQQKETWSDNYGDGQSDNYSLDIISTSKLKNKDAFNLNVKGATGKCNF